MGSPPGPAGLDDRLARLIVAPLLGLIVPPLTGLIDHTAHSALGIAASYVWFIAIAVATWQGNLVLYLHFQDRTAWLTRPWHRVRLLVGLICLFTIPFTTLALWAWATSTEDPSATWPRIGVTVLFVVLAVIFITHVYETVFLVREWESDRMRGERLQREKVEAELDALRSEVDPHTLFNNLNALSHLVEKGSPQTTAFITALASCHRYLLQARTRRLVPVSDELALLDQFVTLIGIRYPGALAVDVQADTLAAGRCLMPPVVLPEILQNAVKHNDLSSERPLRVSIRLEGDRLLVSNAIVPRGPQGTAGPSTGMGLDNLARRCRLLVGTPARWGRLDGQFVVTLPLVME
jgi:hypothetical protein